MAVPAEITCVDCGGRCYRLSHVDPDTGDRVGDVVAYRCGDCLDRWDVVVDEADLIDPTETEPRKVRRRLGGNRP